MRKAQTAILLVVVAGAARAAAAPLPLPPDTVLYFPLVRLDANPQHGLAWSYGSLDRDAWSDYQIAWYYHWASGPWAHVPEQVEFVPMVWCDDSDLWDRAVANIPTDFAGYILLANEPEFPDQCNATPERVAELVYRARQAWPRARLVAPQSHVCWWEDNPPVPPCGLYGERFTVEGFIKAYRVKYRTNPPLHAYGMHYGDVTYWPDRLSAFLDRYGIEAMLWYTEFNHCGSMATFRQRLDYLNQHPRVERYAYWSNLRQDNECALGIYPGGVPNERGLVYAGFGR